MDEQTRAFIAFVENGHKPAPIPDDLQSEARAYREELAALKAKWPNACESCMGTGLIAYDEDVAGDGGSRMQMTDWCGDCLAQGKCPRCGHMLTARKDGYWKRCPECRFVENSNKYHWKY